MIIAIATHCCTTGGFICGVNHCTEQLANIVWPSKPTFHGPRPSRVLIWFCTPAQPPHNSWNSEWNNASQRLPASIRACSTIPADSRSFSLSLSQLDTAGDCNFAVTFSTHWPWLGGFPCHRVLDTPHTQTFCEFNNNARAAVGGRTIREMDAPH